MLAARRVFGAKTNSFPKNGLIAWYDATQITGLADGASVSSWSDLSGNNYTASVIGGSSIHYYTTTAANLIGGKPTVYFTANSALQTTSGAFGTNAQPFTVAVVARRDNPTTSQMAFYGSGSDSMGNYDYGTMNSPWNQWQQDAGSYTNIGPADANPHCHISLYNNTSSYTRIDGIQTATSVGTGTLHDLTIGDTYQFTEGLTGPIGELLIYNRALTTGEITELESYLKNKWGTP